MTRLVGLDVCVPCSAGDHHRCDGPGSITPLDLGAPPRDCACPTCHSTTGDAA